ncbi:MAG: hypothetical protein JSS83_05020 [Cyanobacteria bacterium SZAS LIN-3]|nr:hypothetical protein [Cyanobacteria bacterium SZAS LIN-3]
MTTSKAKVTLLLLAVGFFAACFVAPGSLAKSGSEEWLVEQVHEDRLKATIRVTRDAVALKANPFGCFFLAKAPDWKVHCYRPQEKLEWIGDMHEFSGIVMANPYATVKPTRRGPPPALIGQAIVSGLQCQTYRTFGGELQCCNEIAVDPKVVLFFNRLYGTPLVPSVPLEVTVNKAGRQLPHSGKVNWIDTGIADDLRRGKIRTLKTVSCRKIPFDAKDFQAPSGFKRVVDLIEVSYSKDQRSEIDDMLNNVGFESDLGRKSGGGKK